MDHIDFEHVNELLKVNKLTEESMNFCDWVHDLRAALKSRKIEHMLDT